MTDASGDDLVEMFSDGACRGNPGVGGWGVLLRYKQREKTLSGAEPDTTNNRMELMAAIMGLEALKRNSRVHLVTDSQYVRKGITEWLKDWKRRNWRTARHDLQVSWVRGHTGHPENERADRLANEAIDAMLESETGQ